MLRLNKRILHGISHKNIVLMGPPGAGKTTVGKELAKHLNMKFYDMDDDHLERVKWKRPVADVLKELGDDGFVKAEGESVTDLQADNSVVSLTGSNPLVDRAMNVLRLQGGPLVYLDPPTDVLLDAFAKNDRIVGKKSWMSAADVLAWRRQFYEKNYDIRIVTGHDRATQADIAVKIAKRLPTTWYTSTRGEGGRGVDFSYAIRRGLSPDGGLFIPEKLPTVTVEDELERLSELNTYPEVATLVLELFLTYLPTYSSLTPQELRRMVKKAYGSQWSNKEIVPLRPLKGDQYILELFHGPTAAFKDIALQLFPLLFEHSTRRELSRYLLLTATSGDTGAAVIAGFQHSQTPLMVLFPTHGVSAPQKALMLHNNGGNVRVVPIDSDFDACQRIAKDIFNDTEFCTQLRDKSATVLSSANSINWGRLLPQCVYYFWGYSRLVRNGKISNGQPIDVCVPSGNFGNLFAAFVAKQMGLPLRKLVCASNKNDVLTEFLNTGRYDIRSRSLNKTISPSIDILRASNIERLISFLLEDPKEVVRCMHNLEQNKYFEVNDRAKAKLKEIFWADSCGEKEAAECIRTTQRQEGVLLDPHTAVGKAVADRYQKHCKSNGIEAVPLLLTATAHWAKFPHAVHAALQDSTSQDLDHSSLNSVLKLWDQLKKYDAKSKIPPQLYEAVVSQVNAKEPKSLPANAAVVVEELQKFSAEVAL